MKKREATISDESGEQGLYVYCIGRAAELATLVETDLTSIDGNARLELITVGDIAAVASAVPLNEYGEAALAERLNDPTWTATRAIRHEIAVEHFARKITVIPLRFGTIYLERESVKKMLAERGEDFSVLFARLQERDEWGVNIYADRAKMIDGIADVSPRLIEMNERASKATPGQAYLLRKKIDELRSQEARAQTKVISAEIEEELGTASEGVVRLRTLKDEGSEHGDLVAKLAVLVSREDFAEFRAHAEELAARHAPSGIRIELTGPWPAYNFVEP
jgi:hypothetical protein